MRKMLLNNKDEPSMPVEKSGLNDGQSEEGSYCRTVGQAELPVIRRNNQDEGVKRNGCKYKDFITCGCKGKLQTTYAAHQFRGGAVRWRNTLG